MMPIQKKLTISDWMVIIGIWFSAFVGLFDATINKFALYIILPIIFIASFVSHKSLSSNKYMNILSLLFIWILFSVLWASDMKNAMIQVNQILGSFLLCYIFSIQGRNTKILPYLYASFFVLLISDWYYAYHNMFNVLDLGIDRLNDTKLNANTFGYHLFYATFAMFILGEYNIQGKRLIHILFLLMIPLSFATAILTASRQILIIQIPLIIFLLYGRYLKNSRLRVKILTIIIMIISFVVFSPKVLDLYNNSKLKERNEIDITEDTRALLIKDAIAVGNEHFPFGVGANNYIIYSYNQGFSHNTYLELYVNEGIVGVLIYLYLMLLFLKVQWKRYRTTRDVMYFYFFIAGAIFAFDGLFYVFYPHLWLISFFILVATHSEVYFRNSNLKQT